MNTSESDQSFQRALVVLRRRAPWLLLCFIVATGAAFGLSKLQTKKYTATAQLLFSNNQLATEVAGLPAIYSSGSNSQSVQDTNVALVQIGDMAAKTSDQLRHGLSSQSVEAALTVSAQGDTNLVDVSATSRSATLAAKIAITYS